MGGGGGVEGLILSGDGHGDDGGKGRADHQDRHNQSKDSRQSSFHGFDSFLEVGSGRLIRPSSIGIHIIPNTKQFCKGYLVIFSYCSHFSRLFR